MIVDLTDSERDMLVLLVDFAIERNAIKRLPASEQTLEERMAALYMSITIGTPIARRDLAELSYKLNTHR